MNDFELWLLIGRVVVGIMICLLLIIVALEYRKR
jgi:hypothetical protein